MPSGTIDQLNFEVILHDKDFNEKVKKDVDLARQLNTELSKIASLKLPGAKQLISATGVKNAESMAKSIESIRKNLDALPDKVKVISTHQREVKGAVEGTNTALTGTESLMSSIAKLTGVAFGVAGIRRFAQELINTTGAFEVQKMALTSMLQDAGKADEIFNNLRKNALESPYTFQDLAKYAKQLTAFNIPVDELVETEKRLADVSAGLGVDMGRIILAYGQVKAAGVLKGTELRQFTEAGVPLLEQLAQQIQETEGHAISLSEVFTRISKKQIPFEMVEEAFRRMTSEGGKFYNMQSVLVETLQGKIGKLRDVWQQALYDLGNANSGILKGSVDAITALVGHLDEIGKRIPELISAWGAYAAAQAIAEAGSIRLAVANSRVITGLKSIVTWISKNPYAILAALAVTAAFEITRAYKDAHASVNRLNKAFEDNDKALRNEIGRLDELNQRLKMAGRGTKEWADAKDEAVRAYGQYFDGLDAEITKTGNLETAYKNLTSAIQENVRMRQYTDFEQQERSIRDNAINGIIDKVRSRLYENNKNDRASAFRLMTEIENAARGGIAYDKFLESISAKGLITTGNYVWGDIKAVFDTYQKYTADYLRNTRAMIKEYGLEGTMLDPDFIGPMPPSAKATASSGGGPKWIPTKGKGLELPTIDIYKIEAEVNKDLAEFVGNYIDGLEKATKDWDSFVEEWQRSNQVKLGEGAAYKIGGALSAWDKEDYKILQEYRKHLKDLATQFDENTESYKRGKQMLDEWRDTMRANNEATLNNNLSKIAKDILDEGMSGYDMDDWSHKSIAQIIEIRKALKDVKVPEELREILSDKQFKKLSDELKKLSEAKINNTLDPEMWKAIAKLSKTVADEMSKIGSAISEIGDASNNNALKELGNTMSQLGGFASSVAQGFSSGGAVGAMFAGVQGIIHMVLSDIAEDAKRAQEAQQKAAEAAILYSEAMDKAALAAQDTIFGSNSVGRMREQIAILNKYSAALDKYRSGLALLGYADANGNIDWDRVEAGISSGDINGEGASEIGSALKDYKAALEGIRDVTESLFGDLSSDLTDQFIANFKEMGNAVDNLGDTFTNLGETILKSFLQSYILENILNKYQDEASDALKKYTNREWSYAQYAEWLNGFTQNVQADVAGQSDAINNLISAFAERGLLNIGEESDSESGSLGKGFQSLTEETGSLLASYMNAIRSDVSVIRTIMENGGQSGIPAPTLQDYLQQISASSADTAESNRAILMELQSVIRAPGSAGAVLHVEMG